MAVYTWENRPVAGAPGVDFVWRSGRRESALDRYALAGVFNHGKRRRPWRTLRTPGLNQAYGSQMYGPLTGGLMKSDEGLVTVGKAARYLTEQVLESVAKGDKTMSEAERNIALATNAAGVVAAPAAIWAATKSAKSNAGGVPRDLLGEYGKRVKGRSGKAALRLKRSLDSPKSGRMKAAALGAGVFGVGLQGANALGDSIAARAMANAKREDG